MHSLIAEELRLKYNPVAILFTDTKPSDARQIREGQWGCVMALYLAAMKKGSTAVFDRKTYGCFGGGVGLCLGDTYRPNREFMEKLLAEEERYFKNRELVRDFMDSFEYVDVPHEFVVFKPLDEIDPAIEKPSLISFPVNADQLAALAILINYRRTGNEHVGAPYVAGCQSVCVVPYNESKKENPRGIIGNLDISSRKILPADILTFTVPFRSFLEMEEDVPESFFREETWARISKRI
jgi:uncharacterized protein (DUF169 family)